METFPFNPAPFLPEGFHAIEVANRPARARYICNSFEPANEELAIATILPMAQGEVFFTNVHEILDEFLVEHH